MRARNLELSLLVLGTLVTVVAYASLNAEASTDIQFRVLGFFGIVMALLIGAHLVIRFAAPNADGVLLPLAALLNGLGYVVIARLDPTLADSQLAWTFIGIGAFAAVLLLVPDIGWVADYRYTLALAGVALLMTPLIPGLGRNINGANIWLAVGPFSIQPGEFAKIVLAAFLAGYLVDKRDLLAISNRRILGLNIPAFKYFRSPPPGVGRGPDGHGLPARPRFVAPVLHPLPGHDVRGHGPGRLCGHRARHVLLRGLCLVAPVRPRPAAGRHLVRPLRRPQGGGFPDRRGLLRPGRRGHHR